jgi:hypothetical protein
MKEGLLGETLVVSPRRESEEARVHVACWIGFESSQGRRLSFADCGRIVDEWASVELLLARLAGDKSVRTRLVTGPVRVRASTRGA